MTKLLHNSFSKPGWRVGSLALLLLFGLVTVYGEPLQANEALESVFASVEPTPVPGTGSFPTPTKTPVAPTPTVETVTATPTQTTTPIPGTGVFPTPAATAIPATPLTTPIVPTPDTTPSTTPGTTPSATPVVPTPGMTQATTPIATPPTTTPPPANDALTEALPEQSATFSYNNPDGGGINMFISAGAIDQNTTFVYNEQGTPPPASTTFRLAGHTFTLTAYRNNNAISDFIFQKPVLLVIDYTDNDVANLDEDFLTLFFYDEDAATWSEEGITVIDRDTLNNRITIQITHLTQFALGTREYMIYYPIAVQ